MSKNRSFIGPSFKREDTLMSFSAKQVQALRRRLHSRHIRTRVANDRELSYIEGWYAISEANRIFGFDGWSRETVESRCVVARENRGSFLAVYVAKVRITVQADGSTVIREGHGSGEGRGTFARRGAVPKLVEQAHPIIDIGSPALAAPGEGIAGPALEIPQQQADDRAAG
jgi:Rad52/22 family double-strand break repair protein